ncbi:MAG TPA: hypothetical protein VFQ90_14075 [Stellaceae bacterium]|nr:hypothetical protein [Stellaceae bacterium]
MLNLQPISTSNLLTLVQILILLVGFFFSIKSLDAARASINVAAQNLQIATSNAQAQLYNQLVVQARDLQFKFMELYFSNDLPQKQEIFVGTLISFYSASFELRQVLSLPESFKKLLDNDLRELLREDVARRKWDQIRHLHSREFNEYVSSLRGV